MTEPILAPPRHGTILWLGVCNLILVSALAVGGVLVTWTATNTRHHDDCARHVTALRSQTQNDRDNLFIQAVLENQENPEKAKLDAAQVRVLVAKIAAQKSYDKVIAKEC